MKDLFESLGNQSFKETQGFASSESKYPVLAKCAVRHAILERAENGTMYLTVKLALLNKDNRDETYVDLKTYFITGKGGEQEDYHKRAVTQINNLRYTLNPDLPERSPWKQGQAPIWKWNSESRGWYLSDELKNQLLDIHERTFWGIIVKYDKFQELYVNGYSRIPITPYSVDPIQHRVERGYPETVRVDDYESETKPEFSIWGAFDLTTKQSLEERINGKEPQMINKSLENAMEKAKEGYFRAKKPSAAEELRSRKASLMRRTGKEFSKDRWEREGLASSIDNVHTVQAFTPIEDTSFDTSGFKDEF